MGREPDELTRAGHAAMLIAAVLLWSVNTAKAWSVIKRELRALHDSESDRT